MDALVGSARVCLGGVNAGLHSLVRAASAWAVERDSAAAPSAAAVAMALVGWSAECGFSLWDSFKVRVRVRVGVRARVRVRVGQP